MTQRRVMEFKTMEFRTGLNLTVRDGDKWSNAQDGDVLELQQTGSGKTTKFAVVESATLKNFEEIGKESLWYEHAEDARTKSGLRAAMDRAYGEDNWGPMVTLVFFRIVEEPEPKSGAVSMLIENTFSYHRPFGTQPERYEKIRAKAKEFAYVLSENGCPSAELTLALRDLQRCVMMANASIAVNEAHIGLIGVDAPTSTGFIN